MSSWSYPRKAGLVATAYPAALLAASALLLDADSADGLTDLALEIVGVVLIVVAAPTSWVFAIPALDASVTAIGWIGGVTSLPLWFSAGWLLAKKSPNWRWWWIRYLTFVFAYSGTVLLAVVALTRL